MPGLTKRGSFNVIPSPEELAKYDFSDKSSLTSTIWNVNITFIVLVGVVILLRVYTRARMTGHFFVDDVLAIFAAVFTLVSASTSLVATRYGLGMHVWNLPLPVENVMENVKQCVQVGLPAFPTSSPSLSG